MKRQTQGLGIRDWYGDAFVSLQAEPLKVIDSFFSQYGAFVLSGCEVSVNGSKFDIAPGLVVLEGAGAGNATVKVVVPFDGIKATALPAYLTLGYETETDVYHDGNVKPIADIYKAVATTVKPAGSYVQIIQSGAVRFVDAIQDATHRFITDVERTAWNKAVTDVKSYAPFDYVVDSNDALRSLLTDQTAVNVLVKKGVWDMPAIDVYMPQNIRSITGESGATIRFTEYNALTGNKTCIIENIIFDFTTANSACRGIRRFAGVSGCTFKIGSNLGVMYNVLNIFNCQFICEYDGTNAAAKPFFATGFWVGNIDHCTFEGGIVSNAYDLHNCTFENTKVTDVRSVVNCKFIASTIANSSRIVDCEFYGYDGSTVTTSAVVSGCYGVRGCNIQSGRSYSFSYASPGNDKSTTCGPTAAGGFNFANYGNSGDQYIPDKTDW